MKKYCAKGITQQLSRRTSRLRPGALHNLLETIVGIIIDKKQRKAHAISLTRGFRAANTEFTELMSFSFMRI